MNIKELLKVKKELERKCIGRHDVEVDKDGNTLRIFFPLKYKDINKYDILFDVENIGYDINFEYQGYNFIVCINIFNWVDLIDQEFEQEEYEETRDTLILLFRFIINIMDQSIYDHSILLGELVNFLHENQPKAHHWKELDRDSNYLEINVKSPTSFGLCEELEDIDVDEEMVNQLYQEWWDKVKEEVINLNSSYIKDFGSIGKSNGYAIVKIDNSIEYEEIIESPFDYMHMENLDDILEQIPEPEELETYKNVVEYIKKERDKFYETDINNKLKEIYLK
jgi:hypothetical protein